MKTQATNQAIQTALAQGSSPRVAWLTGMFPPKRHHGTVVWANANRVCVRDEETGKVSKLNANRVLAVSA
jgi:hypothetical protein